MMAMSELDLRFKVLLGRLGKFLVDRFERGDVMKKEDIDWSDMETVGKYLKANMSEGWLSREEEDVIDRVVGILKDSNKDVSKLEGRVEGLEEELEKLKELKSDLEHVVERLSGYKVM